MFSIYNGGSGITEVHFTRATQAALEAAGTTKFSDLISPGDLIRFNTEIKVTKTSEIANSFNVLNEYLFYRGDDYIEELFHAYEVMFGIVSDYNRSNEKDSDKIREKFKKQMANILTLLDIDDIYNYITVVNPIATPHDLRETFDEQYQTDGLGTRDQTYLKEDYKWLMALIVILKAIYGPLAQLVYGSDDHVKKLPELQMLDILKQQDIYKHPAFVKLTVYIVAVVNRTFDKDDDISNTKILATQLPKDTIPEWYLSKAIFGRIVTIDQRVDPTEFNIVKHLYKDVNNKIKNVGASSDAIRNKNRPSDNEDNEDKESVIESYRIATEIAPGIAEELVWITSTVDIILKQLPESILKNLKDEDIKTGMRLVSTFTPDNITNTHIDIIGFLFKSVIDARGLIYLPAVNIYNLIAIGYAMLLSYGTEPLAYILVSKRSSETEDGVVNIFTNVNATKGKGYRSEELEYFFPVKRVDTTSKDLKEGEYEILRWVSMLYIEIFKYTWIPPKELQIGIKNMLTSTLRNVIIDMLIEHEGRI